jgi:tetratricopeptide (TPR) repeat protein
VLFSVLTALNYCGYDQDLNSSEPIRAQIRAEVSKAVQSVNTAVDAGNEMCRFYSDHQTGDAGRDLAQYVSLSLYLNPPAPQFAFKGKEADLPPDAAYVQGFLPLMQKFYNEAGLHKIWLRHQTEYDALVERYHEPVQKMLFATDIYLKLPLSGYLGRGFTVYLEPMGAPDQANARNYASDYYVVVTPKGTSLKIDQIRHTYLHYVLDPFAQKRASTMKRLQPLLEAVRTAPLDDSFKNDVSLLLTESLIRAIEARTAKESKAPDTERQQMVEEDVREGFILTRYFYDELIKFEKDAVGLRDAYPDMLYAIDLARELKRANEIQFVAKASPEVVGSAEAQQPLLRLAEQKLANGDAASAQKLAQQALEEKKEDSGRALFVLAQAAAMNKDIEGARGYFERTIQVAHETRLLAWSHIYLGRIFDLQEERDSAVEQYKAALAVPDVSPEVKAAAQKGLDKAYEPPR